MKTEGTSLGLPQEKIIAGIESLQKAGLTPENWLKMLDVKPAALRRIIAAINRETQAASSQDAVMQALMAAVEKGVQCEDGVYRFFDPGIPLVTLRSLPMIRQKKFVYAQDWFDRYDWAKRQDAPQERTLRIPVEGSFNKTFADQQKLLDADEEVASTRSVAVFLIINALSTDKRLLRDRYVRCIDKGSDGGPVRVGLFDGYGLSVFSRWDDLCFPVIGVAAARKS